MTTETMYPVRQHPFWCDLGDLGCGDRVWDEYAWPNHIGRTSRMFVQSAEGHISLQLSRIDTVVPAGVKVGGLKVRLTMTDAGCLGKATAELSINEIETLALLCANYVEMAKREDKFPSHTTTDVILEEGPC